MADILLQHLADVPKIDLIVSHHAEQDHSGTIPQVLAKYPQAKVVCSAKAKPLLADLLGISEAALVTVADGETISLGDKSLEFIYTPWVHWPETMVTYLQEDLILFSCDFFGSRIASSDLYFTDQGRDGKCRSGIKGWSWPRWGCMAKTAPSCPTGRPLRTKPCLAINFSLSTCCKTPLGISNFSDRVILKNNFL